jgi:hypothetical protein
MSYSESDYYVTKKFAEAQAKEQFYFGMFLGAVGMLIICAVIGVYA